MSPRFERLEDRCMLSGYHLSDYVDPSTLTIIPTVTSFGPPGNYVTPRGIGLDGVVQLSVTNPAGTDIFTGTLLPTGRHILTVAHALTDDDGEIDATQVDILFELPGDIDVPQTVLPGGFNVHPNWTGDSALGEDIAILTLPSPAPAEAKRFDINRSGNELLQVGLVTGYGPGGQGVATLPEGTKRNAFNRMELFLDQNEEVLLYDFDSGAAANDTIGILTVGFLADVGLDFLEGMGTMGDSGGPLLSNGRILGVQSFNAIAQGGVGDAVPGFNASFGELSGATRVSSYASWIDSIVGEPGPPQVWDLQLDGSAWTAPLGRASRPRLPTSCRPGSSLRQSSRKGSI